MNIIIENEEFLLDDDNILQIRVSRRPRAFHERINFSLEDPYFVEKFRMPRSCVEYLVLRLGATIAHPTNCSEALSPLVQILLTLHWLGNGSQYHGIGNSHGVSKASVCRCVNNICSIISRDLLDEEVAWPSNAYSVAEQFFQIAGMPRIAGAVDGTLIPIDAPPENEQAFVDRKGGHSINVMLVSGADYRFYAINSNYPGSVHDSRILQCSRFYHKWNNEGWRPFPGAIIIGDSGYPLRKWLFTPNVPVAVPDGEAKNRFSRKLKRTRQVVECSLGQLKEIFPCLKGLRLKTAISCAKAINACVVLYNIRKRMVTEIVSAYDFDNNANDHEEFYDSSNENDSNNAHALAELNEYINIFNN